MSFQKRSVPFGTTLARQVARQNLTQFNHAFWIAVRSKAVLQKAFPSITFPAGPGVHGVYETAADWRSAVSVHQSWVYQHILVSAASLLEVYIYSITSTALASRPEHLDRSLAGVDGFRFIAKKSCAPPGWKGVDPFCEQFVKGPWEARFRRMQAVFGTLPAKLLAAEAHLQKLQSKRNRIVHDFGVVGDRNAPWEILTRIPASSAECQDAIKLVSAVIKEADNFFAPIIGSYEVLLAYHSWVSRQKNARHMFISGRIFTEFNDYIGKSYGRPLGTAYVKSMVTYYEALSR